MKKLLLFSLLFSLTLTGFAQSRSVERFREDNRPSVKLFFYKSTLKMISRIDLEALGGSSASEFSDMPPIGDMISGIEKVKFFMFEDNDPRNTVTTSTFQQLEEDIRKEGYETLMSARVEGANMNIMMRESRGEPQGFVVLVKMEEGYSIIDIDGYPNVNNILKFSEFINSNGSNMSLSEAFR